MSDNLKAEGFLIKLMFRTDLVKAVLFCVTVSIIELIPTVKALLWKAVLDDFFMIYTTSSYTKTIFVYLIVYLTLGILGFTLENVRSFLGDQLVRRATLHLDTQIMKKIGNTKASFFDSPENYNAVNAAHSSEDYITDEMTQAVVILISIVSFIISMAVFMSYSWSLGLIYLATYIPGAVMGYRNRTRFGQWSIDNIPDTRKKDYYKSLLTEGEAAKELRLYNLAGYFIGKYNTLWQRIRFERDQLWKKGFADIMLASAVTYGGIIFIIVTSVMGVIQGGVTIGTLALYVSLAQSTGYAFQRILESLLNHVKFILPYVRRYLRFVEFEEQQTSTEKLDVPFDVEFRHVFFKYPGSDKYTINDLSFRIEKGEKIAVIGVNGAGKTTIVKLLLGFYQPQSGEILLNGKNMDKYDRDNVYKAFTVCFQKVNPYSLTMRENIALSDLERSRNTEAIREAAVKAGADILAVSSDGEESYDINLTRRFCNEGAEFSGGQWQRIALARTFFRNSFFWILDEPSSALDPEAEDHILSSFSGLDKEHSGILISHRLSNIMLTDRILLLGDGKLIGIGTHNEMMANNPQYAEMYRAQAEKYAGG